MKKSGFFTKLAFAFFASCTLSVVMAQRSDYQQKAKAAGYPEAWVVMVNVGVAKPVPLYPEGTPPALEDSVKYEEGLGPHD